MQRVFALLAAGLAWGGAALALPPVIGHPEKTVGPETCARCHNLEVEVWKKTKHAELYAGAEPLHTRGRAQEIAQKLGVRLVKHDSLCLDCHFTPEHKGEKTTARAGVSCESCHGAARDWINVHNNFEGRDVERAKESAVVRERRVARNAAAGMVFSGTLYDLVSRCYTCHVVPSERLVTVGGHSRGGEVDLGERLESIRHNFLRGGRRENAPFPLERRRQLLVLGPLAELETQLRAIAEASEAGGPYVEAKARRVEKLLRDLGKLGRKTPLPELDAALAAAEGLRLDAGQATLARAADRVGAAGRDFAARHDGSTLAALDPLLAGDEEDGEDAAEVAALGPLEGEEGGDGVADAAPPAAGGAPSGGAATTGGASPSGPRTGGAAPAPAKRGPAGKISAQLRAPLSARKVVGQGKCDACHGEQNGWWYDDPHQKAAEPFFQRSPAVRRISIAYYGRPVDEQLATGRAVCMDCHGSVLTGKEAAEVESGPGCESCHGPAGDYLKPHPEAPRATRLTLGMVDLTAARRAEVCGSCHYVTDPRLLASGHPSGSGFDLAARNDAIRHWKRPGPAKAELAGAWKALLAKRGPLPEVEVVAADLPTGRDRTAAAAADPVVAATRRAASVAPDTPAARPSYRPGAGSAVPRPGDPVAGPAPGLAPLGALALPPLPAEAGSLPLAELLRLVQRRLDLLHRAAAGGSP